MAILSDTVGKKNKQLAKLCLVFVALLMLRVLDAGIDEGHQVPLLPLLLRQFCSAGLLRAMLKAFALDQSFNRIQTAYERDGPGVANLHIDV